MKKKKEVDSTLPRVSFSAIDTYLRCPRQYYFSYVLKIKAPPGVALLEGSSHHKAFEENNKKKISKGRDMKAGQLTEIFMEDFRAKLKTEEKVVWGDEKEDEIFARGKSWHQGYISDIAPSIEPVNVEEKFVLPLDVGGVGFTLSGIIDLETRKKVLDYKTTSEYGFREKKKEINSTLQLSYYAHAANLPNVGFICLIKKPNPEIGIIMSKRSKPQITWALEITKEVVQSIKKESFPMCSPSTWNCNAKWCGYFSQCRGKVEK